MACCKAAFLETIRRSKPVVDPSASVAPVSFPSSLMGLQMTNEHRRSKQTSECSQRREVILSVVRQPLEILLRLAQDLFVVRREAPLRNVRRKKLRLMSMLQSDLRFYQLQLFLLSNQKMAKYLLKVDQQLLESALENQTPEPQSKDADNDNQPLIYFPHYVRRGRQQEPITEQLSSPISFLTKMRLVSETYMLKQRANRHR